MRSPRSRSVNSACPGYLFACWPPTAKRPRSPFSRTRFRIRLPGRECSAEDRPVPARPWLSACHLSPDSPAWIAPTIRISPATWIRRRCENRCVSSAVSRSTCRIRAAWCWRRPVSSPTRSVTCSLLSQMPMAWLSLRCMAVSSMNASSVLSTQAPTSSLPARDVWRT